MSDHVIKVPPLRAGRRVRWTFEVSAAAGGKDPVRTKPSKKAGASAAKRPRPKRQTARTAIARRDNHASVSPSAAAADRKKATPPVSTAPVGTRNSRAAGGRDVKQQPAATSWMSGSYTLAFAAVAALLLAALAMPRHSALAQAASSADANPEGIERSIELDATAQPLAAGVPAALTARVAPIAAPIVRGDAPPAVPPKNTPATPARNAPATPSARVAATLPAPTADRRIDAQDAEPPDATLARADTPAPSAPAPLAPAAENVPALSTVTISGCLEMRADADQFRLTDTTGASAPKSRSWKTGFLKKRAAAVNLIGGVNAPALEHQVGKRVAVTGMQTDHDMTVASVRVVSPSCD